MAIIHQIIVIFASKIANSVEKENKDSKFNRFIADNRERTLVFLVSRYSELSEEDAKDIYQESSVILYQNIKKGKATNLSSSLYTYFLRICINLTLKLVCKKGKHATVGINDQDMMQKDMVSQAKVDSILSAAAACEESEVTERKSKLVFSILEEMTQLCQRLLWSFYADGLSWSTVADMAGLANANSAKSSANRCRNAFKAKYEELKTKIFHGEE